MRKRFAALAFLLALASLALAQVPNGVVGVNYGGDPSVAAGTGTHGSGLYPNYSTFDRIYDANCSTTFHCTWWSTMQPSNTTPTWTGLDMLLDALKSTGKIAEYTNSGVPSWVNSTQNLSTGPEQATFDSFISAMFTHIAGRGECFGYYSAWNEVNQPSTYWVGTAADMATITAATRSSIKTPCPNTVILSPSITAGTDSGSSPLPNGPFEYLDAFLAGCSVGCIDGIDIHGYPMGFFAQTAQPVNQLAPELVANSITNAQALAAKYGLPSAIYIDEGYAESDPSSTTTPANTPAYAAAQADQILLAASMGVSSYANSFYGDGCASQISCGNEFANGRPLNGTNTLYAKRTVGSWLAGATFSAPIQRTVGSNLITKGPNDASAATGNLGGSGTGCPSPPAGAGSLPTTTWNLSASASIAGGMSYYVAAKGASGGIGYLDFRECGTDGSGANSDQIRMDNFTAAATIGQQVVLSGCLGLAAGSLAGIQEIDLQINEYTSTPAYNNQFGTLGQIQPITTVSAAIGSQCYSFRYTVQGAATAFVEPYITIKHYGSVAIDATFRIGNPIENVNATLWSGTLTKAGGYSALVAWNSVNGHTVTAPSGSVDYRDVFGNVHVTSGGATIELNAGWPILIENAQQKAWIPVAPVSAGWQQVPIGGGGFATGGDVAADGTTVARVDVYGAYLLNQAAHKWSLIDTHQSLPAPYNALSQDAGVVEIRVAPSNTNVFYQILGSALRGSNTAGYLVSTNRGVNWKALGCTGFTYSANGNPRLNSPYIGIDPANADIAWMSTASNGVYKIGAGTTVSPTCTHNGTIANATSSEGSLVAYDPTSSVVGGVTQHFWISSYGTGVYETTNGGGAFSLTTGTPTTMRTMKADPNGNLWLIDNSGALHKYASSTWSSVGGPGGGLASIAFNGASNIYVVSNGGNIGLSTNAGSTWSAPGGNSSTRVCPDVPWLCTTNEVFMTSSDIAWDATNSRLDFFEGIGFWYSASPSTTIAWTEESEGIENMVANAAISPPGENPLVYVWDRGVFAASSLSAYPTLNGAAYNLPTNSTTAIGNGTLHFASANTAVIDTNFHMHAYDIQHPTAIPTTALVTGATGTTVTLSNNVTSPGVSSGDTIILSQALVGGWAGDYAQSSPATESCICDQFATTNPGTEISGTTSTNAINAAWTPGTIPSGYGNGTIAGSTAMCDATHEIWAVAGANPQYTTDGRVTWTGISIAGVTTGFGNNNYYIARKVVAADRVTAGNALLYNDGNGKIYATTDCGATWTNPSTPSFTAAGFWEQLISVPGQVGNYFYTPGGQTGTDPNTHPLYRTVNAGVNWTAVSNVEDVWAVATGATAPGHTYPTLFIAAYVNQGSGYSWGIWRSIDNAATWTNVGDGFPGGSTSSIVTMAGNANTYGQVIVGTVGNSFWHN